MDLVLFADDTNIFAQDKSPEELFARVNRGLASLDRWFRCNRLTLNLKKTEYVYFKGPGQGDPGLRLEVGKEGIRRVDGARFLGVWVDGGLKWGAQVERVRNRVAQLYGVLWRAGRVLGGRALLSLYNGLVLPHLQYCLMVWGDFREDGNGAAGGALLRLQKRFAGLVAGREGRYHSDPIFAEYGMLKVGDLYRQQLRVHAWRFWNGRLPGNQAAMLGRVSGAHDYGTRSAGGGMFLVGRDHGSVGYRIPKEWGTLSGEVRGLGSLGAFKRRSRAGFLETYRSFRCRERGCYVCGAGGAAGGNVDEKLVMRGRVCFGVIWNLCGQ